MGLFDLFSGGTPADKAQKLKPKATQKYGDPATRQKALEQLASQRTPESVAVLMQRFTFTVDPHTTDAEEKDSVFRSIVDVGEPAVAPVKDFLFKNDAATSWGFKVLEALVPPDQLATITCELLGHLGKTYTRDPEKKEVALHFLEGRDDPRFAPLLVPFLDDHADDVKIAALKAIAHRKVEAAREPVLQLLTGEETARRVQTAAIAAVAEAGFTVQGFREKVEKRLIEPWYLDKSGALKQRG